MTTELDQDSRARAYVSASIASGIGIVSFASLALAVHAPPAAAMKSLPRCGSARERANTLDPLRLAEMLVPSKLKRAVVIKKIQRVES